MSSTIVNPGGRRRSAPRLDASATGPHTRDLMAKIDALEREIAALPKARPRRERARKQPLRGFWPLVVGLVAVLIAAQVWLHFKPAVPATRPHRAPEALASRAAAPRVAVEPMAPPAAVEPTVPQVAEEPVTPPAAESAPAPAAADDAARASRRAEQRRLARERARRDAEALQQAQAEEQRRVLEAAERARLDESRRIAEAAPQPVAQRPAGPATPEEACADRDNFVSRSLCEARACRQPQWQALPSCVRRREAEEERTRALFPSGGG